ncbi:hypothetical protein Np050604_040 [Cyanophage S-RIM44]|uniref:Uncharacterized protein n=2 Tax=Vellamovirus TaxID=2733139 RepID=A0A127KMI1_9CAUD|nr:virion structural protein [Prochlorococcus phage Syn1]AMO43284.1 hypothetical protein W270710_040 [Cyanophage S-RIM44]ADO99138.1 hypothetical protein Syn1_037 [Prochlorococcus phage Syn1]AOO11756.1 hypothetical protein Np050604_040 [Cyanophage S-RIM44]AOO12457.1 hypothetical protein Sn080709_040 [Cyanophage S-RIM44]AOO12922.1 hypothetical protein W2100709_040 [Cyanophage S-RIM44]
MSNQTVTVNFAFGGSSGTIPGGARNITMQIGGARGGSGGFDSGGPGGGAGNGRFGTFSIPTSSADRGWQAFIGAVGSNGPGGSGAAVGGPGGNLAGRSTGRGGKGGDDGTSGWSGCGAGGGAASVFRLAGARVVTAGGGGGGGGGSYSCGGPQRPGGNGGGAGGFANANPSLNNGGGGANKGGGDGGGGGGGGGGHTGGGGGGAGQDCSFGGGGGGGGTSRYNASVLSLIAQGGVSGNGFGSLQYNLKVAEISYFNLNKTSIIAGQNATLSWGVIDSESQSINAGIGNVAAIDDKVVSPNATTTYILTAIGQAGNDTAQAILTVYQPVVANLRANGQNVSTSITRGQFANLDWVVTGDASSASINQGIGGVLLTSNTNVQPTLTTTYTLSASGLGGSDSDDVIVTVNQPPELAYNPPLQINYGDTLSIDFTYRYATSGVNINAIYTQRNPNTGNAVNITESISLPGTASDESGAAVTNTATFNIPWTLHGTFAVAFTATASGAGGTNPQNTSIGVVVDETPDNITIPDNLDELPLDQIAAPDESLVLSDPIVVTDIEVAAEIRSNFPIQVRFDDNDPDIESNWNDVRQI